MSDEKRRNISLICLLVNILLFGLLFFPIYKVDSSIYNLSSAVVHILYKDILCIILFAFTILILISSFMSISLGIAMPKNRINFVGYGFLGLTFTLEIILLIIVGIKL